MAEKRGVAKANPTKAFFVNMITRDITIEDSILDLIDNSIDAAWKAEGGHPADLETEGGLEDYSIKLTLDSEKFEISDNCGGLSLEDASSYAFTFGRRDDDEQDDFSIGVYGICMKRSVFKLGREISIRSTYSQDGQEDSFVVEIDVPQWLSEPESEEWDFDIYDAEHLDECGVEIVVHELNDDIVETFSDQTFEQTLTRTIARDYSLHLRRGLTITINGKPVRPWHIELLVSEEFQPMRNKYVEQVDDGPVSVEIVAGMAAPPPETSDPESVGDTDQRSGWYVACNGRIVAAADKSHLTGWGSSGWPKWHPQYSGFLGLIMFSAEDASLLPITTTKRNLNLSSTVLRRALPRMKAVTKDWISYTNKRKKNIPIAKARESSAETTSVFALAQSPEVSLPQFEEAEEEKMGNILYSVPIVKITKLAEALGDINMSYKDIGLSSFEYTFDDYVGD